MEVAIHIPVIDLRVLMANPYGRRRLPLWPVGYVDKEPGRSEFVAGFGSLRMTPDESHGGWEGRRQHVPATRAVRFTDNFASFVRSSVNASGWTTIGPGDLHLEVDSRRFYGSARSPRGFMELKISVQDTVPHLSWSQLREVHDLLLGLPVRIGGRGDPNRLVDSPQPLADYVRTHTTRTSFDKPTPRWAIRAGLTQLVTFLNAQPSGDPESAGFASITTDTGTADLFHRDGDSSKLWIVVDPLASRRRTVGLHLSRLHSERAAFVAILHGLAQAEGSPTPAMTAESELVQGALANCAAYLDQHRAYGSDQSGLLQAIDWDLSVHGDDWDLLINSLRRMPHAISSKVQKIIYNYDVRHAQGVQIGNANEMHNAHTEQD